MEFQELVEAVTALGKIKDIQDKHQQILEALTNRVEQIERDLSSMTIAPPPKKAARPRSTNSGTHARPEPTT